MMGSFQKRLLKAEMQSQSMFWRGLSGLLIRYKVNSILLERVKYHCVVRTGFIDPCDKVTLFFKGSFATSRWGLQQPCHLERDRVYLSVAAEVLGQYGCSWLIERVESTGVALSHTSRWKDFEIGAAPEALSNTDHLINLPEAAASL